MTATQTLAGVHRIAIIGLGLIGGSVARGLRATGFTGELVGGLRSAERAAQAETMQLVDRAESDPRAAVAGADLVLVAVPLSQMRPVFEAIADALGDGAIVTDAGSTKQSVIADAQAVFGDRAAWFVPAHPIAGTERSGLDAGFAELFENRRVILTPTPDTRHEAIARVEALWTRLGARVSAMAADHHDEVLAATSHLPHVLAYALVDTLARLDERREIFEYAAGGFADFTRIASSDPVMWRDIVEANRDELVPLLDRYIADLQAVRAEIDGNETDGLHARFVRAKTARDRFVGMSDVAR